MGSSFNASEIVELGVQIEKNGYQFYLLLAENATNSDLKEIFEFLAGQEEKHIAAFQTILSTIQTYAPEGEYPEEYFAYMNELASEHVFTKPGSGAEIAKGITADLDALNMALTFEQNSIDFFEAMKKVVSEKEHSIIDQLIAQEKQHIEKLELFKSTYN